MVNSQHTSLDRVFHVLSDPTRRAMLERLSERPCAVKSLAEPFDMSLPAVSKHLDVLEEAGLIKRTKVGRTRYCQLTPGPLRDAAATLARYEKLWSRLLDSLEAYLENEDPDATRT